ncbi:hypothetical protein [Zobellella sp. An-6]|uniref:hypothetical protein n=1 Tax=Zobellella sp. An-6 TaxID=3400218 RepID=UPI0040416E25
MKRRDTENCLNHYENVIKIRTYYTMSARNYLELAANYRGLGDLGRAAKWLRQAGMSRRAAAALRRDITECRNLLLEACHD